MCLSFPRNVLKTLRRFHVHRQAIWPCGMPCTGIIALSVLDGTHVVVVVVEVGRVCIVVVAAVHRVGLCGCRCDGAAWTSHGSRGARLEWYGCRCIGSIEVAVAVHPGHVELDVERVTHGCGVKSDELPDGLEFFGLTVCTA